jgi:hypothetical protein
VTARPGRCNGWFGAVLFVVLLLVSCWTSAYRGPWAVSNPTLLFRGGHEMGCAPGTAPPEPPSQPTTANIVHPALGELFLMLPCCPNVGDHQPTARTQHPHRFGYGLLPASASADVMDGQT